MKAERIAQLERELDELYAKHHANFDYRRNPDGRGVTAHNPNYEDSEEYVTMKRKIYWLEFTIRKLKDKARFQR